MTMVLTEGRLRDDRAGFLGYADFRDDRDINEDAALALKVRLMATRKASLDLVSTLSPEDMTVQAEDDASPAKWHLAHVTWFFEQFVLTRYLAGYSTFDVRFNFCFNSYYEALGPRHPRPKRGLLTRPSVEEVLAYRAHVDRGLEQLFEGRLVPDALPLIELGLNHEQQHQELIVTDVLALFAQSPLMPAFKPGAKIHPQQASATLGWVSHPGGIQEAGHTGAGFSWDNESPRHEVLLRPFALADRLVTNGEWLAFMTDRGYATPSLWLADGWATVMREDWRAPRYWRNIEGAWHEMSIAGLQPLDDGAPVSHISYYEADAYARWAGHRLPTEFEWEVMASDSRADEMAGLFGSVWQWMASAYLPFPGYAPPQGAIGEYNGKFMVGQHVLRGSSFATPQGHSRPSYRNFFYPHQRWQVTGLRLAREAV